MPLDVEILSPPYLLNFCSGDEILFVLLVYYTLEREYVCSFSPSQVVKPSIAHPILKDPDLVEVIKSCPWLLPFNHHKNLCCLLQRMPMLIIVSLY
jgi:hypothetical protein